MNKNKEAQGISDFLSSICFEQEHHKRKKYSPRCAVSSNQLFPFLRNAVNI